MTLENDDWTPTDTRSSEAEISSYVERAGAAMAAHSIAANARKCDVTELITDILHWADQGGLDCEGILREAQHNWKTERR